MLLRRARTLAPYVAAIAVLWWVHDEIRTRPAEPVPAAPVQVVAAPPARARTAGSPARAHGSEPAIAAPPATPVDPVVAAVFADAGTPAEARVAVRTALVRTGPSVEAWTRDADTSFDAVVTALGGRGRASERRCYAGGCVLAVETADLQVTAELVAAWTTLPSVEAWPGGKLSLEPELVPGGSATTDIVLLRPDSI